MAITGGYVKPGRQPSAPTYKTQAEYDAERLQTAQEKARQQEAAQAAVRAQQAGISAQTGYQNPTTGVNYAYSTGGAGGGTGNRAGMQQSRPFDLWSQYAQAQQRVPKIPPRVSPMGDQDRAAAEAAAFGRAKDQIGLATQGLMRSIANRMASRGISGSGIEAGLTSDAMLGKFGELGEVLRDQAISGLDRKYQIADTNYAGELQQRGQDANAEQARQQSILSLLRLASEGRY